MNDLRKYYSLSWEEVLYGYASGIFPMGEDKDSINWFEANPRAIVPTELPTSKLNITRSLSQILKKKQFQIKIDYAFKEVIRLCARRRSTWINNIIIDTYEDLFCKGFAHSVEAWNGKILVGGLYGVALRGAFFGESMFHLESNASKVCVVRLYEILKQNNYILFDIQMMTPVFRTFGAIQITKRAYVEILKRAMKEERKFKI